MKVDCAWISRCLITAALVCCGGVALAGCGGAFLAEEEQPKGPDPAFARKVVTYPSPEPRGTIIVDPGSHYLYWVQSDGTAVRYGVGVGAEGFVWNGLAMIHTKQEWPDWYPPADMLARRPELREHMVQLQSGLGMKGGPDNPLAPAPCICGRATKTRSTASTASMSRGPSATMSLPAVSA
ncbi:MAG TPA: L,D-transpeptidase [Xanthobacteraceae bacterium]|nr:L,D-transpeptidase [Xanthobacteraceae bacterium]